MLTTYSTHIAKNIKLLSLYVLLGTFVYSCNSEIDEPKTTITAKDFAVTIAENPTGDQLLGKINAQTNTGTITYSLNQQDPSGAFEVTSSGEVKVANAALFDFETNKTLSALVMLKNGDAVKTIDITVTLTDVDETLINSSEVLISSKKAGERSSIFLKAFFTNERMQGILSNIADKAQYDIEYYTITYRSTYKGSPITASGVISIPKGVTTPLPMLAMYHSTIASHQEAPSVSPANPLTLLASGVASAGYVIMNPDYFGFGSSDNIIHPYIEAEASANATIDMIEATKEFLAKRNMKSNDKLFLSGYSEGGYVTGVTLRELEKTGKFKVTASAIGGPAINLIDIMNNVVKADTYETPAFLGYVLASYYSVYDLKNPVTDFLATKYKDVLELFNGTKDTDQINAALTKNIKELLSADFLKDIKDGNKNNIIIQKLEANSWHTFQPKTAVRVYHGEKDVTLPFSGSKKYVDAMKAAGLTNVELVGIPNADHISAAIPMFSQSFAWFETLK